MEKIGRVVTAAVLGLLIGFTAGWFLGKGEGQRQMTVEAVKQNHGHYRIVDELGHTQFEWGTGPAIQPPK